MAASAARVDQTSFEAVVEASVRAGSCSFAVPHPSAGDDQAVDDLLDFGDERVELHRLCKALMTSRSPLG